MSNIPPIRREVLVGADVDMAFDVFTSGIGRWWPLSEHSVHGAGGTVDFVDGELVERSRDGEVCVWGAVTTWEPPFVVAFTWHPGSSKDRASRVEVTFHPSGDQTLVVLEHAGWEVFDDPESARDDYDQGWPAVLSAYVDEVATGSAGETWVALLHTPGPKAPTGQSLFNDPRFGEHVAFLQRMRDAGYLIAAGPLNDRLGDGMTILRLPGAHRRNWQLVWRRKATRASQVDFRRHYSALERHDASLRGQSSNLATKRATFSLIIPIE